MNLDTLYVRTYVNWPDDQKITEEEEKMEDDLVKNAQFQVVEYIRMFKSLPPKDLIFAGSDHCIAYTIDDYLIDFEENSLSLFVSWNYIEYN